MAQLNTKEKEQREQQQRMTQYNSRYDTQIPGRPYDTSIRQDTNIGKN